MRKNLLISLSACLAIILYSCKQENDADKQIFSFAQKDLTAVPSSSYSSLTQVYDNHSLENRIVTFRDERLLTSKGIRTTYNDMPAYKNKDEWEKRKAFLREKVLIASGLWPMPENNALNPKYYHKIDHDKYSVETVSIETYPGYLLVGNLYKPKGNGPFPAILTPHGHFDFGRLNDDVRNSVPALCINFALQGYVVFAYDMVGYNDTKQVSHIFANDSISELYGINLLGLQLRNSIRALDFLLSLPDIDTSKVGITGPSGGGTQTFLLTAVDDRFQATAPVNMVSNTMQGGDLCENAPGLRTHTFNVEIGATVAPKPLLLISDTYDWTFNTRNTIMPMVKSIYQLYDAEDKLENAHFDYIHNYNKASREAAYEFFGKWLLHDSDAIHFREKPFVTDTAKDLLAFMKHRDTTRAKTFKELPASEYSNVPNDLDEAGFKKLLKDIYSKQLEEYWPKNQQSLDTFKTLYGTAFRHLTDFEEPSGIDCKMVGTVKGKNFTATRFLISVKDKNNWIPCVLYQPITKATSTVIVTADAGKDHWVADGSATPIGIIEKLLNEKCNVLAPDLFKQGEHVLQDSTKTLRDETERYFTTYNLTDRQQQIQDLITLIYFIKEASDLPDNISLYSTGNTGITSLLLATVTNEVNQYAIDGNHVNPNSDEEMLSIGIPGLMRVGGLKTALTLDANKHLLLYNAHPSFLTSGVIDVSKLENNSQNFSIATEDAAEDKIVDLLIKPES